jgi:hypothetical protein
MRIVEYPGQNMSYAMVKEVVTIFEFSCWRKDNIYYDFTNLLVQLKGHSMRLKTRIVKVMLFWIALVVLTWMVTGCGSKSAPFPTYMKPELLYLKHQPYSHLYVEIDTIEGVEVPDQWLNELKAFLNKYCSKPEGIEIVKDPPVSLSKVKGMPIGAASILCLDGPDTSSNSQPAYLHVFFHDRNIGLRTERGAPHVAAYCPCRLLFDVSYFRVSKGKAEEFALKHELGHVLGLCKNPKHGNGTHCNNQGCLMYKRPGLLHSFGLLFGFRVEKQLCAECQRDIKTWKYGDVDPKLSFKGPFLIRREDGYYVASLPYYDVIIPTYVEIIDWMKFLSLTKEGMRIRGRAALNEDQKSRRKRWYFKGHWHDPPLIDDSSDSVTEDAAILLRKAVDDPNPVVRCYAKAELEKLKQKQD